MINRWLGTFSGPLISFPFDPTVGTGTDSEKKGEIRTGEEGFKIARRLSDGRDVGLEVPGTVMFYVRLLVGVWVLKVVSTTDVGGVLDPVGTL